jgi:hypothetical protein
LHFVEVTHGNPSNGFQVKIRAYVETSSYKPEEVIPKIGEMMRGLNEEGRKAVEENYSFYERRRYALPKTPQEIKRSFTIEEIEGIKLEFLKRYRSRGMRSMSLDLYLKNEMGINPNEVSDICKYCLAAIISQDMSKDHIVTFIDEKGRQREFRGKRG